jgi:hypothetical protein
MFVIIKNLSQLPEIHFHFPHIFILQTCVKIGKYEIPILGLEDGFDSTNM